MVPLRPGLTPISVEAVNAWNGEIYRSFLPAPVEDPPGPTLGVGALVGALAGLALAGPWGMVAGAGLGAEILGGDGPGDVGLDEVPVAGVGAPVAAVGAEAIGVTDAIVRDLEREQGIRKINQWIVGPATIALGLFMPGLGAITRVWNVTAGGWLIGSAIQTERKVAALRARTDRLRNQLHARRPHREIPQVDLGPGNLGTNPGSLPNW